MIEQNIVTHQNPVKRIGKSLRSFLPFASTHAEAEFMHTIDSDSFQHEETAYLLRSAENRRRLLESIAQLDSGQGTIRELVE